jgi:hypothetical protein
VKLDPGFSCQGFCNELCLWARNVTEAAVTHTVILYSDAKAKNDRFGITDKDGNPVWYGRFFDNDRDYNGEQSSGEMAAANKAVWLASKVGESAGAGGIKFILMVDVQWLTYANSDLINTDAGGKAKALRYAAERLGVVLDVGHVAGLDNPADKYTVCDGYKKWQDNDLAALAKEV